MRARLSNGTLIDRRISRWLGGHILTGINITLCGAGERKVGFCLSQQRCKCYNINILEL